MGGEERAESFTRRSGEARVPGERIDPLPHDREASPVEIREGNPWSGWFGGSRRTVERRGPLVGDGAEIGLPEIGQGCLEHLPQRFEDAEMLPGLGIGLASMMLALASRLLRLGVGRDAAWLGHEGRKELDPQRFDLVPGTSDHVLEPLDPRLLGKLSLLSQGNLEMGSLPGRFELLLERADLTLEMIDPMLQLPINPGRRGLIGEGKLGLEDLAAELAADASADVFGTDPDVGVLTVGAGDPEVARHVPSSSRRRS
jgi:hypothetical protein